MQRFSSFTGFATAAVAVLWVLSCRSAEVQPAEGGGPPALLLTSLNTNADTSAGPLGSALYVVDVETGALSLFPFSQIEGGPVLGQPMHTAFTPDKRKVYVTIGGNAELSLRVVVVELDWSGTRLGARVVKTLEMVEAGTIGNEANGASCHPGGPGIRQEGHGTRVTKDGHFFTVSELQNDRIRVLDTRTDTFIGTPSTHKSLYAPHGLYPNNSGTLAAAPQYWFDRAGISLWCMDKTSGALTYHSTVELEHNGLRGAYLHTIRWLDETRFFTNATQERGQGDGSSEQAVWLVDLSTGKTCAVLDAKDILEGVSDVVIANGKLYVAEGNVAQLLAGDEAPGHLSIWNIKDPWRPVFVKRLSAEKGLPDDFSNAHGVAESHDGRVVFVESFSSNYLIQIDTETDTAVRIFDGSDGLDFTHGLYMRP